VEQINQPTNIKWITIINTSKSRKQWEKRRENTRNSFTQFGPNL